MWHKNEKTPHSTRRACYSSVNYYSISFPVPFRFVAVGRKRSKSHVITQLVRNALYIPTPSPFFYSSSKLLLHDKQLETPSKNKNVPRSSLEDRSACTGMN